MQLHGGLATIFFVALQALSLPFVILSGLIILVGIAKVFAFVVKLVGRRFRHG